VSNQPSLFQRSRCVSWRKSYQDPVPFGDQITCVTPSCATGLPSSSRIFEIDAVNGRPWFSRSLFCSAAGSLLCFGRQLVDAAPTGDHFCHAPRVDSSLPRISRGKGSSSTAEQAEPPTTVRCKLSSLLPIWLLVQQAQPGWSAPPSQLADTWFSSIQALPATRPSRPGRASPSRAPTHRAGIGRAPSV